MTRKDGEFVAEWVLAPSTGVGGSTGGIAFSPDPEQRLLYVSDLTNNRIWFLNRAEAASSARWAAWARTAANSSACT